MGRGVRRGAIFLEEDDYMLFLRLLKKTQNQHPFHLHAICLMTNHFHLEVTTGTEPVWDIMKPLMANYARIFNQKHGFVGHVFGSRYTSSLINDDRYFLEVSRYIHLNPVKAQMVKEPALYDYSSYGYYISDPSRCSQYWKPSWELIAELIDTSRVLSFFQPEPQKHYKMFAEEKTSHAEQEDQIRKDIKEDEMWLPRVRVPDPINKI